MHSVIRFLCGNDVCETLGKAVNAQIPGLYHGPDRGANRFSCTISTQEEWTTHRADVFRAIEQLNDVIIRAANDGIAVVVDIAVEPPDYLGRWLTELRIDAELLGILRGSEIELVISIYGDGPQDDNA